MAKLKASLVALIDKAQPELEFVRFRLEQGIVAFICGFIAAELAVAYTRTNGASVDSIKVVSFVAFFVTAHIVGSWVFPRFRRLPELLK
jgi:hypothetical protein